MKKRSACWIVGYVFMPFMVAYLLSELYRNVNGIVGPVLREELGLGVEYLGLMTSMFLAAVAGAQVFTGIWLDRYGPRRTVAALLLVGALGSVLFAAGGETGVLLLVGRFLIGVGMAGCWTAAFKVNRQWWPTQRLALANGAIIGFAGLGALFSTLPTQLLLAHISWSTLFLGLAGATVAVAFILLTLAPDHPQDRSHRGNHSPPNFAAQFRGFGVILRDPVFLCFAPVSILCQGVWLAFQGLWAGVWLREVSGLDAIAVATGLLWLAVAIVTGNLLLGLAADVAARRGIAISRSMSVICLLYIGVQGVILLGPAAFAVYLWPLFGFLLAGPIFAYALVSAALPANLSGRALSLLNLLATLAGFVMQYGVGVIIELWAANPDGVYPPIAHQTALGLIILFQAAAFLWMLAAQRRGGLPVKSA